LRAVTVAPPIGIAVTKTRCTGWSAVLVDGGGVVPVLDQVANAVS
jgi:hypothetical protein